MISTMFHGTLYYMRKIFQWTYLQNRNRVKGVKKQTYGYREGGGGKRGRDKLGDWDWQIHTTVYKTDN